MSAAVDLCSCDHAVKWHHDSRGCGYLGFSERDRCSCDLDSTAVVAQILAAFKAEAVAAIEAEAESWQYGSHRRALAAAIGIVRDLNTT